MKTRVPAWQIEDLFGKIQHGDQAHRDWLEGAMRAWNHREPIPPVIFSAAEPTVETDERSGLGHFPRLNERP